MQRVTIEVLVDQLERALQQGRLVDVLCYIGQPGGGIGAQWKGRPIIKIIQ
jgi:hypothetical protein